MAFRLVLPGLPPSILLLPAIAIAGTMAGTLTGAAVAVAGLLCADPFRIAPHFALSPSRWGDWGSLAQYGVASLCILSVTHALRMARDRSQACLDVAEIMLVVVGADRRIEAINGHGAALLGAADPPALIGRDWFACFVPPDEREARLRAWSRSLSEGVFAPGDSAVLRQDGAQRLIRWRRSVLRDGSGRVRAVLASGLDVTEIRATEAACRQAEARLGAVLRQVPAAVAIIEAPDGRLSIRSDRSAETLGADPTEPGEMVAWRNYGGCHEDGTPFQGDEYPIVRALRDGEVVEGERFRYRKPDGRLIDLEVYAAPIREPAGNIFAAIGIAFDVSLRADAERMLRLSEASLRQALDAREMLVREANHRIKNSLQMVVSLLTMQRRHAPDGETGDSLAAAIARVNAVAESHLALQLSDDLQTVDFARMLHDICIRLDSLSQTIEVTASAEAGLMLDVDRAIKLALIVSELVTNALRYAYPDSAPGTVRVAATMRDGRLLVSVEDDGVGFDMTLVRSGLGTRVIRGLSAQMGCRTEAISQPGCGTRASLSLDVAQAG